MKINIHSRSLIWLLATPFYFWFSHYFAVFPHEYCHSLVASLTSFKDHFWQIDYGGTSFWNLAFLINIDEHVNYQAMYAAHKDWLVALTGTVEPFEKPWGQTVGYVRDINGVLIELCSPMG